MQCWCVSTTNNTDTTLFCHFYLLFTPLLSTGSFYLPRRALLSPSHKIKTSCLPHVWSQAKVGKAMNTSFSWNSTFKYHQNSIQLNIILREMITKERYRNPDVGWNQGPWRCKAVMIQWTKIWMSEPSNNLQQVFRNCDSQAIVLSMKYFKLFIQMCLIPFDVSSSCTLREYIFASG